MKSSISLPKTVNVEAELMHMLPRFLEARRENIHDLKLALSQHNWQKISDVGHIMAGICGSFGFDELGELGREIEQLALQQQEAAIQERVQQMEQHLAEVKIIEV